ncbi:leucine-rich repeat protein, partial [Clostridiaceae bacterium OttesenSCG-928-D20]|nr:leucine-rich repeat protein [Clostridiaceae bacterium OttesenSCG-928-D20]
WIVNFNTLGGNAEEYTRLIPKGTLEEPAVIGELPTASKLNATFAGWLYDQNDGTTTVSADDEITEDTTIYAKWVEGWKVGENVWAKLEADGTLRFEVVGEGNGVLYTEGATVDDEIYSYPWTAHKDSIKAVVMDEGVVNVPDWAFAWFDEIQNVEIPGVLSIGSSAFYAATKLSSIDLSSVESLGDYAFTSTLITNVVMPKVLAIQKNTFSNCRELITVDIPNVTYIAEYAFSGSAAIETVNMPKAIQIGGAAFLACGALNEVILPDVLYIGDMAFNGCRSLVRAEMPLVGTIDARAFESCSSLREIVLPSAKFILSGAFGYSGLVKAELPVVEEISTETFMGCIELESVYMPDVKFIGGSAFSGCGKLNDITLTSVQTIGTQAFNKCTSLTELNLTEMDMGNGGDIKADAFKGCTGVTKLNMPETTKITTTFASELKNLEEASLPKVTEICNNAFLSNTSNSDGSKGLSKLHTVIMPEVRIIGSGAFAYCSSISNLNLPEVIQIKSGAFVRDNKNPDPTVEEKIHMPKVQIISSAAFRHWANLKELNFKEMDMARTAYQNEEDYGILWPSEIWYDAFEGCTGVTKLTMESTTRFATYDQRYVGLYDIVYGVVQSFAHKLVNLEEVNLPFVKEIDDFAFHYQYSKDYPYDYVTASLEKLRSVNMPIVETIGQSAFAFCTSLENVEMSAVKTVGVNAFRGCKAVKSIKTPNLEKIDNYGFTTCTSLESLDFSSITTLGENALFGTSFTNLDMPNLIEPSNYALSGMKQLENVNFPALTYLSYSMFSGCESLKTLNIPLVTSIGGYCFSYCIALEEIELGVPVISEATFWNCTSLNSVSFPNAVIIQSSAFSGCKELVDVNIPKAQAIETYAFNNCVSLTEITLEEMDLARTAAQNLADHGLNEESRIKENAFEGCTGIIKVSMPNNTIIKSRYMKPGGYYDTYTTKSFLQDMTNLEILDIPKVVEIQSSAFFRPAYASSSTVYPDVYMTKLHTVNMPEVQIIGENAFKGCTALTEINLTEMDLTRTAIQNNDEYGINKASTINSLAFDGCSAVKKLNMPATKIMSGAFAQKLTNLEEVNIESAIEIGASVFSGMTKLASIDMPKVQTIQTAAFNNCKALTEINLIEMDQARTAAQNLEDYGYNANSFIDLNAFTGCEGVTYLNMPAATLIKNHFASKFKNLEELNIPSVIMIGDYAFMQLAELSSVNMPKVQIIDDSVFSGCVSLTEINLTEMNLSRTAAENLDEYGIDRASSIRGNAFLVCTGIKKLDMPATTTIGSEYNFTQSIKNLEEVSIPEVLTIKENTFAGLENLKSVEMTKVQTIGDSAFMNCKSLPSANIPDVKTIGNTTFNGCVELATVNMSDVETIGAHAFFGCVKLRDINTPEVREISGYAFAECTGLTTIEMSNVQNIRDLAFYNCTSLRQASMSEVITIGAGAFENCNSLQQAIIPKATTIDFLAFKNCYDLSAVDLRGAVTIGVEAFAQTPILDFVILPKTLTEVYANSFHENTRIYYFPNFPPEFQVDPNNSDITQDWIPINIGAKHFGIFAVTEDGVTSERVFLVKNEQYEDVYFDNPIVTIQIMEHDDYTYSPEETEKRGSAVFEFNVLENPAAKSELYYIAREGLAPPVAPYRLFLTWKGGAGGVVSASGNATNGYDDVPLLDTFEAIHTSKGEKSAVAVMNFQYIAQTNTLAPGDMRITIPMYAYSNRTNSYMYKFDVSNDMMPKKASDCTVRQPFYYEIDNKTKEVVLINGVEIRKNHSARVELKYTYDPWLVESGETSTFYALGELEDSNNNGMRSEIVSNVLYATINTKISSPVVSVNSATQVLKWNSAWGAQPDGINDEDYFYVKWNYAVDHKFGAQPFDHEISITSGDAKLGIGDTDSYGGVLVSFNGSTTSAEKSGTYGENMINAVVESEAGYVIMAYPVSKIYDSKYKPTVTVRADHYGIDDDNERTHAIGSKQYSYTEIDYTYEPTDPTRPRPTGIIPITVAPRDSEKIEKISSGGLFALADDLAELMEADLGFFSITGSSSVPQLSNYSKKEVEFTLVDDLIFLDGNLLGYGDYEFTYLNYNKSNLSVTDYAINFNDDGSKNYSYSNRASEDMPPVTFYYKNDETDTWKELAVLTDTERIELPEGTYAVSAKIADKASGFSLKFDLGFKLFFTEELYEYKLSKANNIKITNVSTMDIVNEDGEHRGIPGEGSYLLDDNVQSQVKAHDKAVYGDFRKHSAASLEIGHAQGKSTA